MINKFLSFQSSLLTRKEEVKLQPEAIKKGEMREKKSYGVYGTVIITQNECVKEIEREQPAVYLDLNFSSRPEIRTNDFLPEILI